MTDLERSRPGIRTRTGAELQAARREAGLRYEAIGRMYVPEGYTVSYRKSLTGCCDFKNRVIWAPRPITRKSLYIFLHECGHAHLHQGRKKTRHVEEMEAERWAHEKMREHGVAVPRDMTKRLPGRYPKQSRR
jgi:hypothetical protein